ncbi:MAG: hypothetical protein IJP31_07120 [Lachnospiraceae bacterium]|nr:hypothetical protein [Lachnospiraceae bacterium]
MKELKNKEVIIGLVVIIILGIIAILLLVRRELKEHPKIQQPATENTVESDVQEGWYQEEASEEAVLEEQAEAVQEESAEEEKAEEGSEEEKVVQNVLKVENAQSNPSSNKDLYSILGKENYQAAVLVERKTDDGQLKELFEFWDAYKMESVGDLIRLDRIREISATLNGTNKYYYYGSVDSLGRPSGRGLAVYGNNTYYCGEWKEGLRSGQGMWLQIAIYDEANKNLNQGIVEHMYNGKWSKDLPNGQGQEHFSFDYEVLEVEDKIIANVIGDFKDGYYHGDMYIMTTDSKGNTKEWNGVCKNGVWDTLLEGSLTKGVWRSTEMNSERHYDYHFMFPADNTDQGVYGLKK